MADLGLDVGHLGTGAEHQADVRPAQRVWRDRHADRREFLGQAGAVRAFNDWRDDTAANVVLIASFAGPSRERSVRRRAGWRSSPRPRKPTAGSYLLP